MLSWAKKAKGGDLLATSSRTRQIETRRRWHQRLVQAIILLSIAGAVALAWSLLAGPLGLDGGKTWTLTPAKQGGQVDPGGEGSPATAKGSPASTAAGSTRSGETAPAMSAVTETRARADGGSGEAGTGESTSKPGLLPRVSSEDDIPVYIVGAIARPGIYIIRRGSYLYELIELAGGMTAEAAASSINLALRLSENQMVRIPTEAQISDPLNPFSYPTASEAPKPGTVNINTASQAELETLPGVGPAMAAAIIADRKQFGPFAEREDLMRVSGIKESRYAQLEPLITVG